MQKEYLNPFFGKVLRSVKDNRFALYEWQMLEIYHPKDSACVLFEFWDWSQNTFVRKLHLPEVFIGNLNECL